MNRGRTDGKVRLIIELRRPQMLQVTEELIKEMTDLIGEIRGQADY
jgi:hypothetical protein